MRQKLSTNILCILACTVVYSCGNSRDNDSQKPRLKQEFTTYSVPVSGNSFVTVKQNGATANISNTKLENWTTSSSVISTYFRVGKKGKLDVGLKASVPQGTSTIKMTVNGKDKAITLTGSDFKEYIVGEFDITTPGYVKVDIQGVEKTGNYFADVSDIIFRGEAATSENIFTTDKDFYYWTRRGPSCHLGYILPTTEEVEYFYNEILVPDGEDKIGSYFMTNGFNQGYFGIQVNSATERRILFSVWSSFSTDNPNEIPQDEKVLLNRKSADVTSNDFGGEGSGGQSYLKYNWEAGKTYKFLLHGKPDGTGKTDFTAWFQPPNQSTWALIASWKRPKTDTYLKGLYSFLESFNPNTGYLNRKAHYKNQWVRTKSGNWIPINQANFNVDETYNKKHRIDAKGGVVGNSFFLENGGFFNEIVTPNTKFSVSTPTTAPNIDFSSLP